MIPEVVRGFPWPKSMRWGSGPARPGCGPLHSIVATFGPETEEPDDRAVRRRRHRGRRRDARPSLHGAGRHSRCAASTTTSPSSKRPRWCSIRRGAREMILDRRQASGLCARLRAGRGRRAARRGRRPGGMAGDADGLVRRGVPRDPRRGDPRHHPQQPEMLRAARSADAPSSPTNSSSSPTRKRPTAARRSSPATSA